VHARCASFISEYCYRRSTISCRVPIGISSTGGTIPGEMGTGEEFKKFLKELESLTEEYGGKSY